MNDLIVVGLGELGLLFANAALREGLRVTSVLRQTSQAALQEIWDATPGDAAILIAVGEKDLGEAVARVPEGRRAHVILLQNGLFPSVWEGLGLSDPTVMAVWSSKKPGKPLHVGFRSGVYGLHAPLMIRLHERLEIPFEALSSPSDLLSELVAKYAFILTINALGLVENRLLGGWLQDTAVPLDAIIEDATILGDVHTKCTSDHGRVLRLTRAAMMVLSSMPSQGRTALARVEKAAAKASKLGLGLPALEALACWPAKP